MFLSRHHYYPLPFTADPHIILDYEANWTDYRYIKQGWDNSKNFTTSYGEKPTPKGFQEATRILGSMREDHPGSKAGRRYREETRKTEKEGVRPEVKSEVKSEAKPEIKPEVKQEKDSK